MEPEAPTLLEAAVLLEDPELAPQPASRHRLRLRARSKESVRFIVFPILSKSKILYGRLFHPV